MKTNTINKKEIEKFSRMAEEWWNPQGKFKPLHKFNPVRIKYIKENIIKSMNTRNKLQPLSKIKIFYDRFVKNNDNLLVFVSTFVSPISEDNPLPNPFLIFEFIKLHSQFCFLEE